MSLFHERLGEDPERTIEHHSSFSSVKSTCSSLRIEAYHSDLVVTVCNLKLCVQSLGLVLSKPIDRGITAR
jgi:hypothetical protein